MSHFVLELFFDPQTEQAVRDLWLAVDALPGWTPPARGDAVPHLSVCSCPSLDEAEAGHKLSEVAGRTAPLPVEFASVACFPSAEGVVFLAPIVTAPLLALHARLIEAMQRCGATVPGWYAPGNWVPHCTLALGLPPEMVASVVTFALSRPLPAAGTVIGVGLLEVMPPRSRTAALFPLAGRNLEGRTP